LSLFFCKFFLGMPTIWGQCSVSMQFRGFFSLGEQRRHKNTLTLKVVSSEKVGGSRVTSTLGTWYGGVVMGILLSFNEAAILYGDFNSSPSQQQNISVCS
jgi:hypothetical protein